MEARRSLQSTKLAHGHIYVFQKNIPPPPPPSVPVPPYEVPLSHVPSPGLGHPLERDTSSSPPPLPPLLDKTKVQNVKDISAKIFSEHLCASLIPLYYPLLFPPTSPLCLQQPLLE